VGVFAHTSWETGGVRLLQLAGQGDRGALQALTRWSHLEIPEQLLASPAFTKGPAQFREEVLAICFGRPIFQPAVLKALESTVLPVAAVTPQRRQLLLQSK